MEKEQKKTPKKTTKKKEEELTVRKKEFSIEGRLVHICVGDEQKPANDEDINKIEENIKKAIPDDIECIIFVTHHAVKVTVF